jgi:hypothetical protein
VRSCPAAFVEQKSKSLPCSIKENVTAKSEAITPLLADLDVKSNEQNLTVHESANTDKSTSKQILMLVDGHLRRIAIYACCENCHTFSS